MKGEIVIVELRPEHGLAIRERVENEMIPRRMGEIYGELMQHFGRKGIRMAGPPFALYHEFNQKTTDMECGFPVAGKAEGSGHIKAMALPGGRAVKAVHIGPYDRLVDTYNEMQRWMAEQGVRPKQEMWERYLTGPEETDTNKIVTELFWPLEP